MMSQIQSQSTLCIIFLVFFISQASCQSVYPSNLNGLFVDNIAKTHMFNYEQLPTANNQTSVNFLTLVEGQIEGKIRFNSPKPFYTLASYYRDNKVYSASFQVKECEIQQTKHITLTVNQGGFIHNSVQEENLIVVTSKRFIGTEEFRNKTSNQQYKLHTTPIRCDDGQEYDAVSITFAQ